MAEEINPMSARRSPVHSGESLVVLGNTMTLKALGEDTGGAYEIFETRTPPQGGVPLHVHSRQDETTYVLQGEFRFQVGEEVMASPGMLVCLPRNVGHSFRNVGADRGRVLFTISPPTLLPMFEELSRLPATEPPDRGKIAAICRRYGIEFL
jgi:quercetin dioxygenase-like cupin family protein